MLWSLAPETRGLITFLGETDADNVPGKIAEAGFVIGRDFVPDINVENGMAPGEHILNDSIPYLGSV